MSLRSPKTGSVSSSIFNWPGLPYRTYRILGRDLNSHKDALELRHDYISIFTRILACSAAAFNTEVDYINFHFDTTI